MDKYELIQLLSAAIDLFNPLSDEIVGDFLKSNSGFTHQEIYTRVDWDTIFEELDERMEVGL